MHQEIGVEYGKKNVVVHFANGLKVKFQILPSQTLPQSYPSAIRLPEEESVAILEFQSGETMQAWCHEETWLTLIRNGMVPSHPPEFAETLQTCIEAREKLAAAIAQARAEYAAVVDPLTEFKDVGNYEDYAEFRQIPGFPVLSFPNTTLYDERPESDEDD